MKNLRTKSLLLIILGVGLFLVVGCGGDGSTGPPPLKNNKLVLDFFDTEILPQGWLYQVWAYHDTAWIAGPRFGLTTMPATNRRRLIDEQGEEIATNKVTFPALDLTTCDQFRVTIQPPDSISAGLTLFRGDKDGRTADLVSPLTDTSAIGTQYYIYATPSDDNQANEMSGVWFAKLEFADPGLSSFPGLPPGWIFEGWVYHGGEYYSTGRFSASIGADSSCTYYDCEAYPQPPYPGEDFLNLLSPLVFTAGDSVMLTLEPISGLDPYEDRPFLRWYTREVQNFHNPENVWQLNRYPTDPSANLWPEVVVSIETE